MTFVGERTVVAGCDVYGGGGTEGNVVVVGVKLDSASRELLTWSLVNVAHPGDQVIALHVLDPHTVCTTSLLSLVKTFHSVLSVYEGFCNLKQVDLKLKVCRGAKVRKVLVREAIAFGAAKVVVGTCKTHHTLRSSIAVAKYCSQKLSSRVSVFAIDNSKILFQRDAEKPSQDNCSRNSDLKSNTNILEKNCKHSGAKLPEVSTGDCIVDNSMALVPFRPTDQLVSSLNTRESKQGWRLLRRIFVPKQRHAEKSKKTSVFRWVMGLPSWYASSYVHPDSHRKQNSSDTGEDHCSSMDSVNGTIASAVSSSWSLNDLPKELQDLHEKYSSTCRLFSYIELSQATSGFKTENFAGKGGSSHVYRGYLPNGKEVAVKILKPSADVLKEFVSEIDIITHLHHKNITSLLGYCFENNNLALVYNFLSRGSLEDNLHGNKNDDIKAFGWGERYKVALGVAEALEYLHNGSAQNVIHRDVKSSNILLSHDFEPQLSDFGLASLFSTASSLTTCTDVSGTFGYLAPEYFMHGKVSHKMDVYAFGVILLELLSGRKPISGEQPKGNESLVVWARPILKDGKISQLLDPSLCKDYDYDQIGRMALAASLSIRRSPMFRPEMSLVLKLLQGDEEVTNLARQQLSEAEEVVDDEEEEGGGTGTDIQTHINLALVDLDDDSVSDSSNEQVISLEDYLQGRWSRSLSFT